MILLSTSLPVLPARLPALQFPFHLCLVSLSSLASTISISLSYFLQSPFLSLVYQSHHLCSLSSSLVRSQTLFLTFFKSLFFCLPTSSSPFYNSSSYLSSPSYLYLPLFNHSSLLFLTSLLFTYLNS